MPRVFSTRSMTGVSHFQTKVFRFTMIPSTLSSPTPLMEWAKVLSQVSASAGPRAYCEVEIGNRSVQSASGFGVRQRSSEHITNLTLHLCQKYLKVGGKAIFIIPQVHSPQVDCMYRSDEIYNELSCYYSSQQYPVSRAPTGIENLSWIRNQLLSKYLRFGISSNCQARIFVNFQSLVCCYWKASSGLFTWPSWISLT